MALKMGRNTTRNAQTTGWLQGQMLVNLITIVCSIGFALFGMRSTYGISKT